MPTPDQIRTLQIARRKVGLGEAHYRLLLHNVAGVASCKDLDNASFEDVMAVLESFGVQLNERLPNGYWQRKVDQRGTGAGERMVRKIIELQKQQDRYPLAAICLRHSDGRTDQADKLLPREAWNVIEMLKAVAGREHRHAAVAAQADLPF